MNTDIKTYSLEQLQNLMTELSQPNFRAKQLLEWLQVKHVRSYDEMTNLPAALRTQLAARFPLNHIEAIDRQVSSDGTRKYVFSLHDGAQVETVGMPSLRKGDDNHLTVCVSTQVGCAMDCQFCATGKEGFTRNLSASEIVDQVVAVQSDFGQRVSNVVFMGQGEPFLNYDEVVAALRLINNQEGIKIGARHITVSTCGIIEGINRLADEPEQFTLALSLHSAIQYKRDKLMPRVKNQPLDQLKNILRSYIEKTNRRITIEYLLIKDVNDGEEDLEALKQFCSGLLCHINILPMNEIADSPFKPSPKKNTLHWISELEDAHIETTLRKSRGSDIAGACGQLKNSISFRAC